MQYPCLFQNHSRSFANATKRHARPVLLLPAAFDAHTDIPRIGYDAGLGNFDSRPLRIEFFENQIDDAFRQRLEQVEGM